MISKFTRNKQHTERCLIAANIIAVAELGSGNPIPRNQVPSTDHRERLIRYADNNFGGTRSAELTHRDENHRDYEYRLIHHRPVVADRK
jgi:hypothetical protein